MGGGICLSCSTPGDQNDQKHSHSNTSNLTHEAIIKWVINILLDVYRKAKLMNLKIIFYNRY